LNTRERAKVGKKKKKARGTRPDRQTSEGGAQGEKKTQKPQEWGGIKETPQAKQLRKLILEDGKKGNVRGPRILRKGPGGKTKVYKKKVGRKQPGTYRQPSKEKGGGKRRRKGGTGHHDPNRKKTLEP